MQLFRFVALLGLLTMLANCQPNPAGGPTSDTTPTVSKDSLNRNPTTPNPWKDAACNLLTDTEFYTIFGVDEKRDFANRRALTNFCLRSWKKPDWREREAIEVRDPRMSTKPENMLSIKVLDFGTAVMAQENFNVSQRDRVHGLTEIVPGLGEGALWSDSETMLYIDRKSVV